MKLGKLNAAIDAAPKVWVSFRFGAVPVEKGGLKAALRDHFSADRSAETGLTINGDSFLCVEGRPNG